MSHIDNAKAFLAIAEGIDVDPRKAKKDAYRSAAEEIAAHIEETGSSQASVAKDIRRKRDYVHKLMKWRESGYEAETPFLMDKQATSRAARSHAKSVLRDPAERKQVIDSLTDEEKAQVIEDAASKPEVVERVLAKPSKASFAIRKGAESAEDKAARKRLKEAQERQLQGRPSTTLSQYFWRLVGSLSEWARDLRTIREELGDLDDGQRDEVLARHVQLRDEAQRNIDILEGNEPVDDVIEGRVANAPALTA